jgi:predicted nucleic acid-binding protein
LIVLDTSAVIAALVATPANPLLLDRVETSTDLHAPHLIDVEFLHALRSLLRKGQVTADRAQAARDDYRELGLTRYPHIALVDRIWELRENLSAYDAAFVALSEALGAPLVTVNHRLAGSTGHQAAIEAF